MGDIGKRALLIIDVQNDYVDGTVRIEYPPVGVSLGNIGRAIDAAVAVGVPVVVITTVLPGTAPMMAGGTRGAELHEVVASRHMDHAVQKPLPDSFAGTGLAEWLSERNIGTVTVVGYMTHNCDAATVLSAVHRGFAVELLSDATGSLPYANRAGRATAEEMHRVSCVVMQARFANVMTTDEWVDGLRAGTFPARDNIFQSYLRGREG